MALRDPWRISGGARQGNVLRATPRELADARRGWFIVRLGLCVSAWLLSVWSTRNLPLALAGVEIILALALLKDWFGVRSRLPVLNSPRRSDAAAGWGILLLLGLAVLGVTGL
jgi:hypothetical protein